MLSEEVEPLQVVDGILSAVNVVVDDERLASAFQTLLRDDVDNGAKLVEETVERVDEGRDLDALVEVADLCTLLLGDQIVLLERATELAYVDTVSIVSF